MIFISQKISVKEKESEIGHGMIGMCSSGLFENVKTNIIETSDGVTITYTAKNKKDIARL